MQGAASALGLIGTFRGPRDAGTGYVKLYHAMGMATGKRGQWAYLRGAMGSFTQALKRVAQGLGVDIRTGKEVDHICVQGGRATGAVTKDGEEFHSRIVLSNADPKRTYLKLVGKQYLPDEYVRDIENIQITSPVMKINFACDRLPEYPGLRTRGYELGQTGGVIIGPSIEYLQRAYEDARQGRPADWPFFSIHAQSAVDRTLAPEGKQTFSIFTQFFPYELAEGTWDERRDEIAKHVLARFAWYAPNMADAEITAQVLAPPDIEARFGLTGGHIFQGELVPEQAFDMRPVPGSQSYQGPISRALPLRLRRLAGRLRDGRARATTPPTRRSTGCGRGSTGETARRQGRGAASRARIMQLALSAACNLPTAMPIATVIAIRRTWTEVERCPVSGWKVVGEERSHSR